VDIEGFVKPGFESVLESFIGNFTHRHEVGAGCAVMHAGELVVDLWGGARDPQGSPWREDTLVMTYSTSKPFAASCALLLVDRGAIALDERVATYWPEFGQAGKGSVTVRELLSHQAGLIALREDLPTEAIFDRDRIVKALEREEPWWPPGTRHGEHAYFYGHLVEELVRRVDGRSLHDFFATEIAEPWNIDFHMPLDRNDRDRAADLVGIEEAWPGGVVGDEGSLYRRAITNPPAALLPKVINTIGWRAAEVPAINGYGTAKGIARFYAGLLGGGTLDGKRIFSEDICREASTVQCSGIDLFLEEEAEWGLGFALEDQYVGHGGLGGSLGFAVRDLDLAIAYVTNKMAEHDRADAVFDEAERIVKNLRG
jgi:CubicO group peptidase (beta-lactamase class C family)